jgi:hypothetical protein
MYRRGVSRLVVVILSTDPVKSNRILLQDNHLLRGHIVCCLQRIEVSTAGHLLSGLRPPILVNSTISSQVGTRFLKSYIQTPY